MPMLSAVSSSLEAVHVVAFVRELQWHLQAFSSLIMKQHCGSSVVNDNQTVILLLSLLNFLFKVGSVCHSFCLIARSTIRCFSLYVTLKDCEAQNQAHTYVHTIQTISKFAVIRVRPQEAHLKYVCSLRSQQLEFQSCFVLWFLLFTGQLQLCE